MIWENHILNPNPYINSQAVYGWDSALQPPISFNQTSAWCYRRVWAWAFRPSPLCGASLMSLACKVIPALNKSVLRTAIFLHSSGKPLKMQGDWGCLLNTSATMLWINPKDHHMKVIKLPPSIMNGTISRDSGLLLWDGWMGERSTGEGLLCTTTLVSCCADDD